MRWTFISGRLSAPPDTSPGRARWVPRPTRWRSWTILSREGDPGAVRRRCVDHAAHSPLWWLPRNRAHDWGARRRIHRGRSPSTLRSLRWPLQPTGYDHPDMMPALAVMGPPCVALLRYVLREIPGRERGRMASCCQTARGHALWGRSSSVWTPRPSISLTTRRRPRLRSALVEVHASWPTRMPLAAPLFPHLLA